MSEEYGLKFVVNGEDYDEIKKSLNEQIEDLQQKVEQLEKELQITANKCKQLENIRKEAIEYMKEFIFEPLLINEDRKLIMFNENLKNFENILNKGDNNVKD